MLSRRTEPHRGNTKHSGPESTGVVAPFADGSWREVDESWYAVDEWLDESFGTQREPDNRTPPPRWESLPKVQPIHIRPQQRLYREPHPGTYTTLGDDIDRSSMPSFDFDRGALFDSSDARSTAFRPNSANPSARMTGLPSLSIPTNNNALARSISPHDSPQEFEPSSKSPGRSTYSLFPKFRSRATALWSTKDSTVDVAADYAKRPLPATPKSPPTSFGSPGGLASPRSFLSSPPISHSYFGDAPPRVQTPKPLAEDQLQGLCKGAVKTVLGKGAGGFSAAKRAVGVYGLEPCWKCSKCDFKGAMAYQRPPGKPQNTAEKAFDPTIRTSLVRGLDGFTGGVRYRWIFLAKCHTALKAKAADATSFDQPHADEIGGFGCVFCCADENQPSVFFQNITSFLQHLELHRREDMWPSPELMTRMKCVAGRSAGKHEDWEINLMPLISQS